MPDLHVVCHRPGGMIRAGVKHPRHAVHKLDAFTSAQLREMLDEPELTVIIGHRVMASDIPDIEAHIAEIAARAKDDAEVTAKADVATKTELKPEKPKTEKVKV